MGWLHGPDFTKESIRKEMTDEQSRPDGYFKTLRSTFHGNTLWALHESKRGEDVQRWIGCYRLAKHDGWWGYKSVDESMGPIYYDCPVTYLDEATEPANEYAREWREQVRAHAKAAAAQRAKKPAQGEVWSLRGCKIPQVRIHSAKPLRGYHGGVLYRIKRRHLGEKMESV
jgi:hypothetical protein